MKNRLLLGLASLIICGANGAVAQALVARQASYALDACSDFDCDDNADCERLGCGNCGSPPSGGKRCKAASVE